ncbi:MAG: AAA domain-containing protein, partial [Nitrosomonadaceae bacterium]|nr:AAA domain-containing protein [Nitrosomonadaceae bacterium]
MLTDSIITAFAGIKEPNIPIGNYIFIGNTGIGKTYTAQNLNDIMIGIRKSFHRFDMSEFAEGHEYTKLIGAPSGYRGFEKGGQLTNAVAAWPFCVILADEIEEAHEKTRKIFLVVMDEGHLKEGQGNEVFFGKSTLIMTSNLGARDVEAYAKRTGFRAPGQPNVLARAKEDTLRKAVEEFFPAKFLNRVDDIIYFRDLEWEEYLTIAELELAKTTSLISAGRSIVVTPSPEIIAWIRDNGCNTDYGARPLKRFIKKHFRLPLARMILDPKSGIDKGDKLIADLYQGELHFEKE